MFKRQQVILYLYVIFLLPILCFAGRTISFDPVTGVMEITLTGDEDITITKHPQTGGLAINGECSGVLASGIRRLVINGDDGIDRIDLRGMIPEDFPGLVGVDEFGRPKTEVHTAGGPDQFYGHNMGNEVDTGDGDDEIDSGDGFDIVDSGAGFDVIETGIGHDIIYPGPDSDVVRPGPGNDTVFGNYYDIINQSYGVTDENSIYGNDDTIHMTNSNQPNLSILTDSEIIHKNILDKPGHAVLIDSTGVDSLSLKEFSTRVHIDLNLWNTPQIYTENGDTLTLYGVFETVVGTGFNDSFYLQPNADNPITIDGFGGNDTLIVDCMGLDVVDDGQTITVIGYQPITYLNNTECIVNNTSSIQSKSTLVNEFVLYQNYPNPFNPCTDISFQVPYSGHVRLTIYNMRGEQIAKLVNEQLTVGFHNFTWNAQNFSSGLYYYNLFFDNQLIRTHKMILLR